MPFDYTNHQQTIEALGEAQKVEEDNRERVREATHFLKKKDGQWEPDIIDVFDGKPRYTFDKCNPIVDQIMGELARSEFTIRVSPAGGESSQDDAQTMDGLIRNIENISQAEHIFTDAARKMVETGLGGWRVVTDWADSDAFDQDLLIKKISNYGDRVWFDTNAELPTMEDADWVIVQHPLTPSVYKDKYPEGSGESLSDNRHESAYWHKKDEIIIGELLYKERTKRTLFLMSDGKVYADDDEGFLQVRDDLERSGVTVVRERTRDSVTVFSRKFDGKGWLEEKKETPFSLLPIVPCFGNFDVSENKVIYRGAIEKLMDQQRVHNYARSRQIEEGALAPRGKYWLTPEQAAGFEDTLETLNTNNDGAQLYNHVPDQPQPWFQPGGTTNPGLQMIAQDVSNDLNAAAGMFAANMADNPGLQSGVAIGLQQDKGDNGTFKYFSAHKLAIEYTGRVILKAIPKVYDSRRAVRIIGEDGKSEIITLKDRVVDQETQQTVEVNDLTRGLYDLTVTVAPHFENRQQETVTAITEIAQIDPTIIQDGSDVLLNNINAPGFDRLSQRRRQKMVLSGQIPEEEMTDEEKQLVAQQQESANQPDPVSVALIEQANAETQYKQAQTAEKISSIELNQQKFLLQAQTQQQEFELKMTKALEEFQTSQDQSLKTQAEILKLIREASGADAIVGPGLVDNFKTQSDILTESQQDVSNSGSLPVARL